MLVLYRLLRPEEEENFMTDGLSAKDINSTVSVNDHVTNGSRGPPSSYISCSKSEEAIMDFASKSITHPQTIVKIQIDPYDPSIEIIDLTDPWTLDELVNDEREGETLPENLTKFSSKDIFLQNVFQSCQLKIDFKCNHLINDTL